MALKFKETLHRTIHKIHVKSVRNMFYYMAKSVFVMRLVNLQSVTSYADQNLKANARFPALNLDISEKRFKESYKMSVNHEDLDVDFVLQHCNSEIFMTEGDEETES